MTKMSVMDNPVCAMMRYPDVLEFLFRCTATQADNPNRFSPSPKWFYHKGAKATDSLDGSKVVDMARFRTAVDGCNIKQLCHRYQKITHDSSLVKKGMLEDVYQLLRFIVQVELRLQHVELYAGKQRFDQFKTVWDHAREDRFIAAAKANDSYPKGIQYLYHGSPVFNWHSIIRNGLKVMSGTTYMTTGAVWGNGIYLSDQMATSYGYTHTAVPHRYGNAIVVGVYEVYDAARYRKTTGIYVVPSEDLLLLRYLVYVDRPENIVGLGQAMNQQLHQNSLRRVKMLDRSSERRNNRIQRDLEQLRKDTDWTVDDLDGNYKVQYQGVTMQVSFPPGYPGVPPTVEVDGRVTCDETWNTAWRLGPYLESIYWGRDSLKNRQ